MNDQDKRNRAVYARELQANPFLSEIFITLKAKYLQKLTAIKKGKSYEKELCDVHDSLQNLQRLEAFIDRCVADGKIVDEKERRGLFNKR